MAKVFIIGSFADSLIRFRGAMLRTLIAQGHEVVACAPEVNKALRDGLKRIGVECMDVPLARTGLNPLKDLRTLVTLVGIFRRYRPDIVLSYTIKPVIYGSLAASVAGVPLICSMITGLGYAFAGGGIKKKLVRLAVCCLYRIALHFNARVFFQNPDNRNLFLELGLVSSEAQTVLINGSGVDLEQFPLQAVPSHVNFLLIARLIHDKGVVEYAEAARLLKERYPQARFMLVGWIDENPSAIGRDELQSWVGGGYIEYLGRLDDVHPALEEASVFVLPSYYPEGTPRTILEAMAMGRAVVTTDAPGCRETVIHGENGFLVPIRNVPALMEAMECFLIEPKLAKKMGERSRRIAEEKYDVRKVNKVILREMGLLCETIA